MLDSNNVLQLGPGVHILDNFSTNVLRDVSNVSIVGNTTHPEGVVISCTKDIGLFFFNVTYLHISGVTVESCGLGGSGRVSKAFSVVYELMEVTHQPLADFSAALFLAHCPHVVLSNVVIRDNRGLGLLGLNLLGDVTFHRVQVLQNYPTQCFLSFTNYKGDLGTGGGMFISYQDYNGTATPLATQFHISESDFSNNYVCRPNRFSILLDRLPQSIPHPITPDFSISGAGGMTLSLAQSQFQVRANFMRCVFRNNSGTHTGSALHIQQFEFTNNSHVIVDQTSFIDNGWELYNLYGNEGIGLSGTVLVWHYTPSMRGTDRVKFASNSVRVTNSYFRKNVASKGGGIYVLSFGSKIEVFRDTFNVTDTIFEGNKADFGGALYLTEMSYSAFASKLDVTLESINVTENLKRNPLAIDSLQTNSGVVYVSSLDILFCGDNYIAQNRDTALLLNRATVRFAGYNLFEFNVASTGGALHLVSESYVVLSSGANLLFHQNFAVIAGGAIHVQQESSSSLNNYDCILFFEDPDFFCNLLDNCTLVHVEVNFINNTSPLGSAIYGTTFSNCPWVGGSFDDSIDFDSVVQSFSPAVSIQPFGSNSINTPAKFLHPPESMMDNETITIMPGKEFELTIGAFDQLNYSVPLTVFSKLHLENHIPRVRATIGETNRYLINRVSNFSTIPLSVYGEEDTVYEVSITSDEAKVQFVFNVNLSSCILGFAYDNQSKECVCQVDRIMEGSNVVCENNGSISLPLGPWMGYIEEERGYIYRPCLFDYCDETVTNIYLDDPDKQCRKNRSGLLCGECTEGYSRVLGSNGCNDCSNNAYLALILVFFLMGIVLVVVISLSNITITDGYINGIIFYSNITSLYFSSTLPIYDSSKFIIEWINLNFGITACFYDGMTDLHLALLNLVFPLYLGTILLVITLLSKYIQSRRLAALLNKINILHVFATLLLLAYASIVRTCLDLISHTTINIVGDNNKTTVRWRIDPNQVYFDDLHIIGVFVAILLLVLLFLFPFLFLFPQVSLRLPCINRFKPLIDAFIAPLEDKKIWWVGFRIICRNILFTLTLLDESPRNIVLCILIVLLTIMGACVKPFKTALRNYIDIMVMVNLSLVSILVVVSQGNSSNPEVVLIMIHVLISFFSAAAVAMLVSYVVIALPCTEKLKQSVVLLFKKKLSHSPKACSRGGEAHKRPKNLGMSHGSFVIRRCDNGSDFESTECVDYRESIFETSLEMPEPEVVDGIIVYQ